jgi:serine/threonine protein kinase
MDDETEDFLHQPDSEPIPGYRLLAPLGKGGFGEVWKCEAPGGLHKAIKFVYGELHALDTNAPAEEELRAIQRVKVIRHPFLLSMERVERVGNELAIVMELADKGLGDVMADERSAGRVGIPREQLLSYLREAAEALDVLNKQHGLQHLDVKPQNLFLVSNHVKVGDFGLVSNLQAGELGLGAITPLYASPEVFQGSISAHSDQYSLAIVYQELLTGALPFTGKNSRMLMLQHAQQEPDLQPLPEGDRPVVARALSKDPRDRFSSCTELINALTHGVTEVVIPLSQADTRKLPTARTVRTRPSETARPVVPECADGPLTITELVTRSPLTEVWRAKVPDGSTRLVSVLFGCAGPGDPAIARLVNLHHPHLQPIEVLQHTPGRLVLCQEPGDRTLRDVMQTHQGRGLPGIPRRELLGYLRTVAETLATLAEKAGGAQHLGLNPRSFVLFGRTLQIANFGLAQFVWLPTNQNVAQLNVRYSAPELVLRQPSPACDQYSLALIYHELLTGAYPAAGKPARRGETAIPVLDLLPGSDRMLIGRALHPDPKKRWESPWELVRALEAATADEEPETKPLPLPVPPTRIVLPAPTHHSPAERQAMQIRFGTSLAPDVIRQRLESFRTQWNATSQGSEESRLVYRMKAPRNFWHQWTGEPPGLEMTLAICAPDVSVPAGVQTRTEVQLDMAARECSRDEGREMLERVGPLLAESVRQHLQLGSRGRQQERLVWLHEFQLHPVLPGGACGPAVECQGKDISLNGIGFYVQKTLPTAQVMLVLPQTPQTPQMSVPARVVRVQSFGDGWFEVGAVLQPPDELPPEEDDEQVELG